MGTFIVGAAIALMAACAVRSIYKDKKAGRCSGCSGCSGNCPSCTGGGAPNNSPGPAGEKIIDKTAPM
ncbi:MAG: FeoB-associated Cys-rich membrane protein [Lachnospiraceae bacterium]|jgi:hypothetical protein|nr:FeoB-associated Cys-rich membrane protein [Lachnospiraceae bacterium]